MNTKQLKEMAETEGLKVDNKGTVVIEPTDSKKEPEVNKFMTKTQIKRHKLNSEVKLERRVRIETEVVPTDNYLRTSMAGNSVNATIGGVRYTIPHHEIAQYVEGLTNSIRLFIVREKPAEQTEVTE